MRIRWILKALSETCVIYPDLRQRLVWKSQLIRIFRLHLHLFNQGASGDSPAFRYAKMSRCAIRSRLFGKGCRLFSVLPDVQGTPT